MIQTGNWLAAPSSPYLSFTEYHFPVVPDPEAPGYGILLDTDSPYAPDLTADGYGTSVGLGSGSIRFPLRMSAVIAYACIAAVLF